MSTSNRKETQCPTQHPLPIDHIRLGAIRAAIWSNDTENGPRFSVTVERMYRERESNEWKYSGTFNRDDLLTLAKVADSAHPDP
ncbi:MAG: hypothetical protein R3B46_01925 [Phycisphaerales bacterium]